MTEPMPLPAARAAAGIRRGIVACLAVTAGTVLLGVAAGFLWSVAAPRPLLVMTGRGAAAVINAETSAFIAADGWYCFICLAGGLLTGLFGYLLAVRRYGPVAMVMVLAMRAVAVLLPARSGGIYFAWTRILTYARPSERVETGLALVPEGRFVFPEFTVEDTLRVGAYCTRARAGMTERKAQMYGLFPRLYERRRSLAGALSEASSKCWRLPVGLCRHRACCCLTSPVLVWLRSSLHKCLRRSSPSPRAKSRLPRRSKT